MNLHIHSKDLKLTDSVKVHIESAIDSFTKYSLDITTINVNIIAEKKNVLVEFDIHIAHAKPVVINQRDDVLDAAIDLAIERANKALRRLHDRVVSQKKQGSLKDLETLEA